MLDKRVRNRKHKRQKEEEDNQNEYSSLEKDNTQFNKFFGDLDNDEIEYFKQLENKISLNDFVSDDEEKTFYSSIFEEIKDKELKLVTNRSTTKLIQKLIYISDKDKIKRFADVFKTNYLCLSFNRFSSFIVESLLMKLGEFCQKEFSNKNIDSSNVVTNQTNVYEEYILNAYNELKNSVDEIILHEFSSHVLRALILVFSAKTFNSFITSSSILKSKNNKNFQKDFNTKDNNLIGYKYNTLPKTFLNGLLDIRDRILRNKSSTQLKELSIHKNASLSVQLLLTLEGIVDKDRALWYNIFLNSDEKNQREEDYIAYLTSDPIGSHFLEFIIINNGVKLNQISRLYNLYIKDNILKILKRFTSGSYVIQAFIVKNNFKDGKFIIEELVKNLDQLTPDLHHNIFDLYQKLIFASTLHSNLFKNEIRCFFLKLFAPDFDEEDLLKDTSPIILNIIFDIENTNLKKIDKINTAQLVKKVNFLQKLIHYDYIFVIVLWKFFISLSSEKFYDICSHEILSHVVQNSLVLYPDTKEPETIKILRRKLLNIFENQILALSVNVYGSYIIDKLWDFTVFLPLYKERFATILSTNSDSIKESIYGKLVCKNWHINLFNIKLRDWKQIVKSQEESLVKLKKNEIDNKNIVIKFNPKKQKLH